MNKEQSDPFSGGSLPFSTLEVFTMVRRRWIPGLLLGLLLAGPLAYWLSQSSIIYEANTELMIEGAAPRVLTNMDDLSDMRQGEALVNLHLVRLGSRYFSELVADSLSNEEEAALLAPFFDPENPDFIPGIVNVLRGAFSVFPRGNSQVLVFRGRHPDPAMAIFVANRYADVYLEYLGGLRSGSSDRAIEFLQQQVEEARRAVEEGEAGLQEFRREHELISIVESQRTVSQELQSLSAAVNSANLSILELESEIHLIQEAGDDLEALARIAVLVDTAIIGTLVERIEALREERELLSRDYLERHPRMIQNANRHEVAERQLRAAIIRRSDVLRNQINGFEARIERLVKQIAEAESRARELDRIAVLYGVEEREVQSKRQTYQRLIDRLNETLVVSRLEMTSLRVMDRAEWANATGHASLNRVILASATVFALGFVGLPVLLGLFDRRMRTFMDVERVLSRPLLGFVSEFKRSRAERQRATLIVEEEELVESFRTIFSNFLLNSSTGDLHPRALVVSSSLPAEGKTFIVANLGAMFARHGRKTLLVDTDLRRPSLGRGFGCANETGLLAWYRARSVNGELPPGSPFDDPLLGLQEVAPNLHLIPSGGSTKAPTETLSSSLFDVFVSACKQRYDMILFDTPPVGVFPDAGLLGVFVDGSVFVVRQQKVDRVAAKNSVELLDNADASVLGVILNGVSSDPSGGMGGARANYGRYGYVEKYRRAYEEETPKAKTEKHN